MKNYSLYLDESTITENSKVLAFCLGGVIIEQKEYEIEIIPSIKKIKHGIFGNDDVILHEYDIRQASAGAYKVFRNEETRTKFWTELSATINRFVSIKCIGVCIDCKKLCDIYNSDYRKKEYNIALQMILENYTHFLTTNNGKGVVFIESRDVVSDLNLQDQYHFLKVNGSLFIEKREYQDRLGTISFPPKTDNVIGLQLADFIPNCLARKALKRSQKEPSILSTIEGKLYDGEMKMSDRFGLKVIP